MFTVIAYDTSDDRLRKTLARTLEGVGRRVQGSVFEAYLDSARYIRLRERLMALTDGREDVSVRCYRLCGPCEARTQELGVGPEFGAPAYFLF
ncbi:MAG: CRISPR-associated endonuclease Cas2 [Pseudomonadota bacterium]